MSLFDYKQSIDITARDYSFYALIMAAMRQADTYNLSRLQNEFPEVHIELVKRYNAPGGVLPEEEKDY